MPWTLAHRSMTSPFLAAGLVMAAEDVFREMDAEALAAGVAAVDGTGAAFLRAAAAQTGG
jgi:hypothetical protein